MSSLQPYNGPTRLILAFDIGTTFSCVSYSILEPHRVPEVLPVARFPAQGAARADTKVPSLLYYDKDGTVRAVGAEVLAQDVNETARTEGWMKAEWWKLHLQPNHLSSPDLPALPSGKSAVDILTDFIKYLFECSRTYIQECHPSFPLSTVENSIEYILTYPSGWGERQYLYRQAAERAGLVPNTPEGQLRVHTLSEGEAVLHSCIGHLTRETTNETIPEGIVAIDAGGGIVDVSMFSVTVDPFSFEEIAPAECRLQGSVFVSRRAKALIERKLEGWEHSSAENIARFTREFDQTTKLVIESKEEAAYVRIAGRRTNSSRHSISSGQLKLTGEEATGLFNESVDSIISAFEKQQRSATTEIKVAFLVGGLSANDWLWSRLQSYFTTKGIRIHRPGDHIGKAVAEGAVLSHIGHWKDARARCARCALPIKVSSKEPIRKRTTLQDRLSGIFSWMLTFMRESNLRDWFSLMHRNTVGYLMHTRDRLSLQKGTDQDRRGLDIATSSPMLCTACADLGKSTKDVPLSGVAVRNPTKCAELDSGIKEEPGTEDQSRTVHSSATQAVDNKERAIAGTGVTNVFLALRRLVAGFLYFGTAPQIRAWNPK